MIKQHANANKAGQFFISSPYHRVNSSSRRPAACPRDPEIHYQSEIPGSRGQAAGRRRDSLFCNMERIQFFLFIFFFSFFSYPTHATPAPVTEAFQVSANLRDPNLFSLKWIIKPGYYLYADRIQIINSQQNSLKLGVLNFPKPFEKKNRLGQIDKLYRDKLNIEIPVLANKPGEYKLNVHYQGCADDGYCYPPQNDAIQLSFDKSRALFDVHFLPKNDVDIPKPLTPPGKNLINSTAPLGAQTDSAQNHIENLFHSTHPIMVLIMFAGFGLLLSFTPCVLPMIPVLSGLIVSHGHNISTRKAFFLSLNYVLGMSFTYALIGAIAAKMGANLQVVMQLPIVIAIFSIIFILLALSMFGLYELRLPVNWQAKFAQLTRNRADGHYWNAAIMGCLSTLVLSPCVTPPLVGALGYIINSGNVMMGSLALFALGLGMGIPLLVIGTSSGKWLPKAGLWMNTIKAFFGVLLLSMSIYLMTRILPAPVIMGLWSVLLVLSGIFAGAFDTATNHGERLFKGVGILFLTYGLIILTGLALGNTDPLQPLRSLSLTHTAPEVQQHLKVKTNAELDLALSNARGNPVMLDFYADWCTSCKVMEATTLKDPAVIKALEKFKVIIVDLSDNSNASQALMDRFHVVAPPTFVFLNAEGQELTTKRLVGDVNRNIFLNL